MRVRLGTVVTVAAASLLIASAVGLLGAWALGVGAALLVGMSVVTAIVWEERDRAASPAPKPAQQPRTDELVAAPVAGR